MKNFMKFSFFCFVSLITWAITSSLVAQQNARKSKQPVASTIPETTIRTIESKTVLDPKIELPPMVLGTSPALAEAHLRSHEITVVDGVATVRAHVSLLDKRKEMSYVWRVRVVDSDSNPLAGQVYDKQLFSVEANGQKEVDFEDTVLVPKRAYRIELVLYEKAPQNDLSFLENDKTARGYQKIRVVKMVAQ